MPPSNRRDMQILLVDDSKFDAKLIQRTLSKTATDAVLVHAFDGQEALEMLDPKNAQRPFDGPFFILLDVNMPRMNGHEFLRSLRSGDFAENSLVFMFSTSDNPFDIECAYKNSANGYIVKPRSTEEIAQIFDALQSFWNVCEPPPSYAR